MTKLCRFIRLPLKCKAIYLEAYILLGFSRIIIMCISFRYTAKMLGEKGKETAYDNAGFDIKKVFRVKRAVNIISQYTFWKSKCLVQACTAKMMLKRRGIASTLYMGVGKGEKEELQAHAWLRCGTIYVTGGVGEGYAVTGVFS